MVAVMARDVIKDRLPSTPAHGVDILRGDSLVWYTRPPLGYMLDMADKRCIATS